MGRPRLDANVWLVVIFAFYFLTAAAYSVLMPMWEGPDEPAHYVIVLNLVRARFYSNLNYSYEAAQPRAYYYLASLPILILDSFNSSSDNMFMPHADWQNVYRPAPIFEWSHQNYRFLTGPYALRWINILLGGLALWLNWITFRRIVPEKPFLSLAALALAALVPEYLHIMSSIGNDALGTLAGALLFYLAIRLVSQLSLFSAFLSIAAAVILPLTTKLTALPLGLAVLIAAFWRGTGRLQNKKRLLLFGSIVSLGSLGILYLLSPATLRSSVAQIGWRLFNVRPESLKGIYLTTMLSQVIWSFWGKVGWLAVALPVWMVNLLTILALAGMLLSAISQIRSSPRGSQPSVWRVTWIAVLLSIAAVLKNGLNTDLTQGRFLFPAIGPLALLMVAGWYEILPQRFRSDLVIIVIILMLAATLALWHFGIVPVYFQPFLD